MDNKKLAKKFGTPLFVINVQEMTRRYRKIRNAFEKHHGKVTVAYAYKANYIPFVCRHFQKLGAGADVVGDMEYDLAKRVGLDAPKTIINGPHKPRLEEAIVRGCIINVDNFSELDRINKISKKMKKEANVGIRMNTRKGGLSWNQFGFNLETGQFAEAVERALRMKFVRVLGPHVHIGTNVIDTKLYSESARAVIKAVKVMEGLGTKADVINFGGGFPSENACPSDFEMEEWKPPGIEEFARALCGPVKKHFREKKPSLVVEPGRYLADDAVSLLTSVVAVKDLFGTHSVTVDAGVNVIQSARFRKRKIGTNSKQEKILTDIYGPTCMASDLLEAGVSIPEPRVGDIIEFSACGAYEESLSTQFLFYRPAVVSVDGGKVTLVRRREQLKDVIGRDIV